MLTVEHMRMSLTVDAAKVKLSELQGSGLRLTSILRLLSLVCIQQPQHHKTCWLKDRHTVLINKTCYLAILRRTPLHWVFPIGI
ncbi:hypothetical protein M9434_007190 [Picochlorum sp. BPE23]|nr:hypothetical protein M9434_007190 [Picochlorum sp. BPE23]